MLPPQSWGAVLEITQLIESETFTLWPFKEKLPTPSTAILLDSPLSSLFN
jgi:hypothetical protein